MIRRFTGSDKVVLLGRLTRTFVSSTSCQVRRRSTAVNVRLRLRLSRKPDEPSQNKTKQSASNEADQKISAIPTVFVKKEDMYSERHQRKGKDKSNSELWGHAHSLDLSLVTGHSEAGALAHYAPKWPEEGGSESG